jgi:hypothetical protein
MYPGKNYVLFAHGCDRIDAENNPIIANISEGNVYISMNGCGIVSLAHEWGDTVFNLQNNAETTLYKEIEKKTLLEGKKNIPYHVSDGITLTDYIDNIITPIVDIDNQKGDNMFNLYRSGLIPVDYIHTVNDIVYEVFENFYNTILYYYSSETNEIGRSDGVPIKALDGKPLETIVTAVFQGSVYPTVEEVLGIFHKYPLDAVADISIKKRNFIAFKKEVIKTFKIPVSELFNRFPGTYLNTSCRAVCGSTEEDDSLNQTEQVKMRRAYSLDKRGGNKRKKTLKKKSSRKTYKKKKTLKKKKNYKNRSKKTLKKKNKKEKSIKR